MISVEGHKHRRFESYLPLMLREVSTMTPRHMPSTNSTFTFQTSSKKFEDDESLRGREM